MASRFIYLPTLQHTGTWFMLNFLRSHPEVDGFFEMKNYPRLALNRPRGLMVFPDQAPGSKVTLMQEHLTLEERSNALTFTTSKLVMMRICPTVIPLRDPLLSIMTRLNRHPETDHMPHVRAWEAAAITFGQSDATWLPVKFAPVDVARDLESRRVLLEGVLTALGLGYPEHAGHFAQSWPADTNSSGDYALKQAYQAGDAAFIKRNMPVLWDGLKLREPILRPWLEAQGYKDLLWWD